MVIGQIPPTLRCLECQLVALRPLILCQLFPVLGSLHYAVRNRTSWCTCWYPRRALAEAIGLGILRSSVVDGTVLLGLSLPKSGGGSLTFMCCSTRVEGNSALLSGFLKGECMDGRSPWFRSDVGQISSRGGAPRDYFTFPRPEVVRRCSKRHGLLRAGKISVRLLVPLGS